MKKRLLSWLLVLSMVISLIPSTLVTALAADLPSAQASGQAGKTKVELSNEWPSDLSADITDVTVSNSFAPGPTLTVEEGKTLIVHGNGTLSGVGRSEGTPFFIVKDGGHLVLDEVTVTENSADAGTVVVEKGGLLDLGYNDQKDRIAPGITNNTTAANAAKNLVIADGATVRLNAETTKVIGLSYYAQETPSAPISLLQGGRYTLKETDMQKITADVPAIGKTGNTLTLLYDQVLMRGYSKVLVWSPTDFTATMGTVGTDSILQYLSNSGFQEVTKKYDCSLLDSAIGDLKQYDMILILFPVGWDPASTYAEREMAALRSYLDSGGRVYFQCENVRETFAIANQKASQMAGMLGAGFEIKSTPAINMEKLNTNAAISDIMTGTEKTRWITAEASPIVPAEGKNIKYKSLAYVTLQGANYDVIVEQQAGSGEEKWGSLLVVSDTNIFYGNGPVLGLNRVNAELFFNNLYKSTMKIRDKAAAGYNPNAKFVAQATTTTTTTTTATTDYRTPYAALQKAVDNDTVTLLTKSNTELTPTRDELLFEHSTLAYEAGSTYHGSKIHADTAGVYLDITKTGDVNLRSGTVTVTPNSAAYPLALNGTMDPNGDAITGGYKITSATKYQLIADDPTSPILAENGGKASITATEEGQTFTVTEPGGTEVTYTAKTAGEKIYLGRYQVIYDLSNYSQYTAAEKPTHGAIFVQKFEPMTGYEMNGGSFKVSFLDKNGKETKVNTELSAADSVDGVKSVWKSADGQVTIEQTYQNGLSTGITITVTDVKADISIYTVDKATVETNPAITLRGVGTDKDGLPLTQPLYEIPTTMSYKDGVTTKPIESIPWEKYKLVGVKVGTTEGSLQQQDLTDETSDKNAPEANKTYTMLDLTQGANIIVEFQYEWNLVEVKVKTATADGTELGVTRTDDMEAGVEGTVAAPYIPGYAPVDATKQFTPAKGDPNELTFTYKKISDKVLYKAVDEQGHELGSFEGPQIVKGDTPDVSYTNAPTMPGYTVKQEDGTAAPAGAYNGTDTITITWTYTQARKTITVNLWEYKDDAAAGYKGDQLRLDSTTYAGMALGQTLKIKAPTLAGYDVKTEAGSQILVGEHEVFVSQNGVDSVDFFYQKQTVPTQVEVKLIDDDDGGKTIQTYAVPTVAGQATLVTAPTLLGYKLAANEDASKTVPDGTTEVEFHYVWDQPVTVRVVLQNNGANPVESLTPPENYITEYKLKAGDSVDIWAPVMKGYSLMSSDLDNVTQTTHGYVKVDYAAGASKIVTFGYFPVSQAEFVTHTVIFKVGFGTTPVNYSELYTYHTLVAQNDGTTAYEADNVKNIIPGYKLEKIELNVEGTVSENPSVMNAPNNKDATITYYFAEDSARIIVEQYGGDPDNGGKLLADGTLELTGYRIGQEGIVVVAPARTDYALKDVMTKPAPSPLQATNTVKFEYEALGAIQFHLYDVDSPDKPFAIKNALPSTAYSVTDADGLLNLSAEHYTFSPNANASDGFKVGETGSVTTGGNTDKSNPTVYKVYYEKSTRNVEFIAVDSAKLGGKTVEEALAAGDNIDAAIIRNLTITTPEAARVGESYKAVAQSFDGWALADQMSKYYPVENRPSESLKVYFAYKQKTSGTVTVHYHFGVDTLDHTQQGPLLVEYSIQAVVGENVTVNAPDYLLDNKYKLRTGQTNPLTFPVVGGNGNNIEFYYEANYVTVTVKTSLDGNETPYETREAIKATSTPFAAETVTLYPPYKAGYTLVGITGVTNGAADKLPDEYADGKLTLTGLTADATIVYHYKPTSASEFQTDLKIQYRYNGYDLAAEKTVKVNRGDANTIEIPSFDGYQASAWQLSTASGSTTIAPGASSISVTIPNDAVTRTLTITYIRPDGSVVLPGKDTRFPAPDDGDNVVVKPDDQAKPPLANTPGQGKVTIPTDTTGTVTRPDPENPGTKEDIQVPGGTVIDPDGTIHLPDGGDIGPDGKIPENLPQNYVAILYQPNGGTGDVVKQIVKRGAAIAAIPNPFQGQNGKTFQNWNERESGGGTSYTPGDALAVDANANSLTLFAQWSQGNYAYDATITYHPNGASGAAVTQTEGSNRDTKFAMRLQANTFTLGGWNFGGWNEQENGRGNLYQPGGTLTLNSGDNKPLYAQWYRVNPDGSITVPGKDGNPNTPDNNATANGNGTESPERKDTGEIKIPNGGSVTTGSGETIPLPNGGILKPDGTVIINRPEGGTITVPGTDGTNPDVTTPDGSPDAGKTVVEILYESNNPQNKTIRSYAVVGDTIKLLPSTSFVYDGHQFLNWRENANKAYTAEAEIQVATAMTLQAQWAKLNPDGSVELPGQDGKLPAPNHGDNVTVTPDKPGSIKPQPDGSVKVDGGPGTVERPKDPTKPEQGKEEIKVPDGTIVKPDGTIELPKNPDGTGGGTINPGDKLPDNVPAGYHTVTYTDGANNSYQLVEDGKNATALGSSTFSPPVGKYFHKWKENTSGDEFGAGDEISAAIVTTNPTFTAQWSGLGGDLLTITPGYTSAKQGATIRLQAMINGSAVAADKVTWNVAKLGSAASAGTVNSSGDLTVPANAADRDVFVVTAENNGQTANAYIAVNAPIGGTGGSGGGEGSGSSTRIYTITATAGAHGSIDPEGKVSVKGGSDKVFTISPNNGYRIEEVRVDGRSVGTVSYYIFSNVDENHTISVTFAEARPANNNGIADPTETGVAGWLQTREHIAYLGGYGNGLFGPDDNMTRAQAAQMFYNLLLNKNVDITVNFSDVQGSDWYATAVNTLASLGIIRGVGGGVFDPNRSITRAEFATIALRFADKTADGTNPFTDVASNDWYYFAVLNAVGFGWITGYSDGTFRPNASITRAEVATIVNRMLDRNADHDFVNGNATASFVDVPSNHWAYYNIMEATTPHTHTVDRNGNESWGKLQ